MKNPMKNRVTLSTWIFDEMSFDEASENVLRTVLRIYSTVLGQPIPEDPSLAFAIYAREQLERQLAQL